MKSILWRVGNVNVSQIIRTAKEFFRRHPAFKAQLWGGNFWTNGYDENMVGR
jgi:hypothetical protein